MAFHDSALARESTDSGTHPLIKILVIRTYVSASLEGIRFANFWIIRVTISAFVGHLFVNHDHLVGYQIGLRMALGAFDVGVAAGQRQMRSRVVIESGRDPSLRVVAIAAMGLPVFCDELPVMRVLVAIFALLRRAFET
jgi:hypothetical protein